MPTEEVVRGYFAALDAEDWAALGALVHDQCTFRVPGARTRHGRDEVLATFRSMFAAWAEHRDTVTTLIVEGDRAAAEVRFTATTRAGRQVRFDAVDLFRVRDDSIHELSLWYDLGAVSRMIREGLPDAEPTTGQPADRREGSPDRT